MEGGESWLLHSVGSLASALQWLAIDKPSQPCSHSLSMPLDPCHLEPVLQYLTFTPSIYVSSCVPEVVKATSVPLWKPLLSNCAAKAGREVESPAWGR